jgi:drug/metabolite transporter (DMT)-like permease
LTEPARATDKRALAALVFGAMVIGLAPILVRLTATGPAAAGAWRLAFALPLLALITLRTEGGPGVPPRPALLAGVMFALDIGFWHYGLHLTTVVNATVLSNLTPVVVTLAAWRLYRQRPRASFAGAGLLALAGVALMSAERGGNPGPNPPLGDALSTATALWYAGYFLAIGAARRDAGAARVMFWSTLVSTPLLFAAALGLSEQLIPETAAGWMACVGLGLVHVAGQGTIAWALGRLPTALASVTVLVQPVVAGLMGWLLFGETLSPLGAVGGAVALAGVVLAQRAGQPAEKP